VDVIRLHGYIGKEAFWGDEITLAWVQSELEKVEGGEVKIEINSGGGDVNEGFAIADFLRSSGKVIHTEILGLCGSIATIVALAAKPENRTMHSNSDYFVHNPYWSPNMERMGAKDVESVLKSLKDAEERILDYYVKHTSADRETLQSYMDAQTTMSAEEAKNLGFISAILGEEVKNKRKPLILAYVPQNEKQNTTKFMSNPILAKIDQVISMLRGEKEEVKAAESLAEWLSTKEEDVTVAVSEAFGEDRYAEIVAGGCPTMAEIEKIAEISGADVLEVQTVAETGGCSYEVDETEAMKAENDALKEKLNNTQAELDELKAQLSAEKESGEAIKAQFENEIAEIKQMVIGAEPPKPKAERETSSMFAGIKENLTKAKQNRA
jgi:ATP-dependent protease ClpP protease subunit